MSESLRPGYGQQLAQARAGKELSVVDVAAKLKLTVRQVEALEAEDESLLPAKVFLRGFVRNYARLVDLNPDDLIAPVDAQATVAETITAPSEGLSLSKSGVRRWVVAPLVILGVFVLFVAVLYQWLRQGEEALVPDATTSSGHNVALPTVVPPAPVPNPSAGLSMHQEVENRSEQSAVQPAPATSAAVAPGPTAAMSEPPPKVVVSGKVEAQPKTEAPTSSASAGGHVLRFQTTQDAWIQVVDGEGKRYSKLIRAGGSDSISGAAPFKLVVGEAAQVRLTYDGQPIDLTPFIGQRVARLTLE